MKTRSRSWGWVIVLGVLTGLGLSTRPWVVARQQAALTQQQQQKMRESEARYAEDRRLESRYGGQVGREELARKQGFIKPNETPVDPRR